MFEMEIKPGIGIRHENARLESNRTHVEACQWAQSGDPQFTPKGKNPDARKPSESQIIMVVIEGASVWEGASHSILPARTVSTILTLG